MLTTKTVLVNFVRRSYLRKTTPATRKLHSISRKCQRNRPWWSPTRKRTKPSAPVHVTPGSNRFSLASIFARESEPNPATTRTLPRNPKRWQMARRVSVWRTWAIRVSWTLCFSRFTTFSSSHTTSAICRRLNSRNHVRITRAASRRTSTKYFSSKSCERFVETILIAL